MSLKNMMPWAKKMDKEIATSDFPFFSLQKDINRLFENFWSDSFLPASSENLWKNSFEPKINVVENEKEIRVEAELPGLEEKDVEVTLQDNSLIIKGEKKDTKENKSDNYHVYESSYGSFYRSIPLPSGIDTNKIDAVYKNGVMKITVPKTEEAAKKQKKIEIKTK